MEKLKRKANLKKLQLPASVALRKSKRAATTSALSNYFSRDLIDTPIFESDDEDNTEQEHNNVMDMLRDFKDETEDYPKPLEADVKPKRSKRTKLTDFVFRNKEEAAAALAKIHLNDCDETPQKKVKKAPKSIHSSSRTTRAKTNSRNKRQPDIKSAFFRNEKLFSELAAQHSMADNLDPDDLQLALAISKSQAESEGIICLDDEKAIDLVKNGRDKKEIQNTKECLRNRFQQFGFKTAEREEFQKLADGILPFGKRKSKAKWANKFTPLTLRIPEIQQKKINERIEGVLARQSKMPSSNDINEKVVYTLNSDFLKKYQATEEETIFDKAEFFSTDNLNKFFVGNLFDVCSTKSGYLLKDWDLIQGRDSSPNRLTEKRIKQRQRFNNAYAKLAQEIYREEHKDLLEPKSNKVETIKENNSNKCEAALEIAEKVRNNNMNKLENKLDVSTLSSTKEITQEVVNEFIAGYRLSNELKVKTFSLEKKDSITQNVSSDISNSNVSKSFQFARSTSPDIFADDSDEETSASMIVSTLDNQIGEHHNGSIKVLDFKSNFTKPAKTEVNSLIKDDIKGDFEMDIDDCLLGTLNGIQNKLQNFNELPAHKTTTEEASNMIEWDESFTLTEMHYLKEEAKKFSLDNNYIENTESSRNTSISPTKVAIGRDNEDDCVLISDDELNISICNVEKLEAELKISPQSQENERDDALNVSIFKSQVCSSRKTGNLKDCVQFLANEFNSTNSILTKNRIKETIEFPNTQDFDDDCIVLSDDEINYSICKSNKKQRLKKIKRGSLLFFDTATNCDEYLEILNDEKFNRESKTKKFESFSSEDSTIETERSSSFEMRLSNRLLDIENEFCWKSPMQPIKNVPITSPKVCNRLSDIENDFCWKSPRQSLKALTTTSPKECNHSLERAEFGILESQSETFSEPQYDTPSKASTSAMCNDASFLTSPNEANALRRFNNRKSNKFSSLIEAVSYAGHDEDIEDEFDKLVYGDTQNLNEHSTDLPNGIEQLLTAEISFNFANETSSNISLKTQKKIERTPEKTKLPSIEKLTDEIEIDGKSYSLRLTKSPKPDFTQQTETELFKQLYNYGIKPLKRKQAIKILEYIYTQTHPILMEDMEKENETVSISKAKENNMKFVCSTNSQISANSTEIDNRTALSPTQVKLNLNDCAGATLMRFSMELHPELYNEDYIFQTNISKKISQALLPLHIAWYNLIHSSNALHETILMYEPIDLQEIYIFLKSIGYRYDPKDLKIFFDRRCIIFRYDLTASNKNNNRHVRKAQIIGAKKCR